MHKSTKQLFPSLLPCTHHLFVSTITHMHTHAHTHTHTNQSRGTLVHVVAPVLVLAEGTTVTSLVTPTTGFCGTTATIPAALKGR